MLSPKEGNINSLKQKYIVITPNNNINNIFIVHLSFGIKREESQINLSKEKKEAKAIDHNKIAIL